MNLIDRLSTIEDPIKRRTLFVGLLTQEIKRRGGKEPIVVAGLSLEIYINTQWLLYCIVHNLTKVHRYGEGFA